MQVDYRNAIIYTCRLSVTGHPYDLYGSEGVRFWVHYGLVILGAVLAGVTVVVQWRSPAPYGKHERRVGDYCKACLHIRSWWVPYRNLVKHGYTNI